MYKQLFCSIVPHVTLLRTHMLGEFIFQPHNSFLGRYYALLYLELPYVCKGLHPIIDYRFPWENENG
jgi:hypothetical protein